MALKRKIDASKFDTLADAIKFEYKKIGDDEYVLQTEGDEDTGALKRAKDREAQARKDAEERAESLQTELDTLNASRSRKDRDLDTLTRQHETKIKEITTEYDGKLAKSNGYIRDTLIERTASEIAHKISKAPAVLLPHIKSRLVADLDGDAPTVKVLKDGKPSELTVEDLSKEFVANKDFSSIIIASQASGGAGSASRSNGGAVKVPGATPDTPPDLSKLSPAAMVEHLRANKASE